jgi:hypothetical protein
MARFFQVTPPSVHSTILTLERRGLITRAPGQARSIALRLPPQELPHLYGSYATTNIPPPARRDDGQQPTDTEQACCVSAKCSLKTGLQPESARRLGVCSPHGHADRVLRSRRGGCPPRSNICAATPVSCTTKDVWKQHPKPRSRRTCNLCSLPARFGPQALAALDLMIWSSSLSRCQANKIDVCRPFVRHRGGPKGFLKVIDERTIAFADFRGNALRKICRQIWRKIFCQGLPPFPSSPRPAPRGKFRGWFRGRLNPPRNRHA